MPDSLFRPEALRRLRVEPWQPPLLARRASGPLIGILALVAAALLGLFSTSFEFSRKELATGYLAPASGWTRVTASATGVVTRRAVEPGDRVGPGDPLLQFGASDGIGPERTVERSILDEIVEQEQTLEGHLDALEARFEADVALHRERTALDERMLAGIERELVLLRSRLTTARKRLGDGRLLARSGHVSRAELLALADEAHSRALALSEKERDAERMRSAVAAADARLDSLAASRERDRAETRERLHDVRVRATRIRGAGFGFVLAPVAGVVASVRVSVGDPLRPGDLLLDTVPPEQPLRARLFVRSSAMGTLEVGQPVRVYLDAFPQERHGAQAGEIAAIFETPAELGFEGAPTFRVDVGFPDGWDLDAERQRALRPGMTLSADVVVGRATLVQWVLEPLRGAAGRL